MDNETNAEIIARVWSILDPAQKFASLEDAARNVMQSVVLFQTVKK